MTGTDYTDYGKLTALRYGNETQLAYTYYDGSAVDPLSGSAYSYRLRTVASVGGTVNLSMEYQYDKVGNILAVIDRGSDDAGVGSSQHFAYDSADRLTSASGLYGDRAYQYDAVGNLVSFDSRRYEYGVGNRLAADGQWRYQYDENGNVVERVNQDITQAFAYDDLNRLISFRQGADLGETYAYDEAETRIKKHSGDITTYYVSADYEERWQDGERIEVIKHYRSGEQKVATRDADGLKYVYPDQLQSSARMADAAGNQIKAIWYTPFGATVREQGTATARYRFTGKEKDDSGLYYYGARYYDDTLGRFLAADSVLPNVYDPQQLNRFAYVRNNPVKLVDPDGHAPIAAMVLIPFLYTAVTGNVVTFTILGVGISTAAVATIAATSTDEGDVGHIVAGSDEDEGSGDSGEEERDSDTKNVDNDESASEEAEFPEDELSEEREFWREVLNHPVVVKRIQERMKKIGWDFHVTAGMSTFGYSGHLPEKLALYMLRKMEKDVLQREKDFVLPKKMPGWLSAEDFKPDEKPKRDRSEDDDDDDVNK